MTDRSADKPELLVLSGVEGGGVAMEGVRTADGWRYIIGGEDQTPLLIDEAPMVTGKCVTESWNEALAALDALKWYRLPALRVHPDLRERVWEAIKQRADKLSAQPERRERLLQRWRERCEIGTSRFERQLPTPTLSPRTMICDNDAEPSWVYAYYEALEFLYWEPQHLGKQAERPRYTSAAKVRAHLGQMEVTLNHNLNQFFALAPDSLRNDLFGRVFGTTFHDPFRLVGRDVGQRFRLQSAVQPDLLFLSGEQTVAIEMKLGAKSSITQVLKYALLGLAVELVRKRELQHHLLYLGVGPFSRLWTEQFADAKALHQVLTVTDLETFLKTRPAHFRHHSQRFAQIVNQLSISYITYSTLANELTRMAPDATEDSPGGQVYRKLIGGIVAEFSRRHLVS